MTRWKSLVLATASFGLLTGVALAQDQPDPQTNPPIEDKSKVDDEVKKPDDINKGEGMGTEPGKGLGGDKVDEPKLDEPKLNEPKVDEAKPDETKAGGELKGGDIKGEKPGDVKGDVAGGHTKMQIQDVQTKLKEQGLYKGEVDGLIGPQTKSAVKQFQKSKGLTVNGELDAATLSAMGISGEAAPAPAQPTPPQ